MLSSNLEGQLVIMRSCLNILKSIEACYKAIYVVCVVLISNRLFRFGGVLY